MAFKSFKIGDKILLSNGVEVSIVKELGQGTQGTVYQVNCGGNAYALKCYKQKKVVFENVTALANAGSPGDMFAWPIAVFDNPTYGCGYMMKFIPQGFHSSGEILYSKQYHFKNERAKLNACINLVNAIRLLHKAGWIYRDVSSGNVFFNNQTGDVMLCDVDNVCPKENVRTTILGTSGYMAPEILRGEQHSQASDMFSVGVLMFQLLFRCLPFEDGKACEDMFGDEINEYMKNRAVFVFDPKNKKNRLDNKRFDNNIKLWNRTPDFIKTMFYGLFSAESLQNKPESRLTAHNALKPLQLWSDVSFLHCGYLNTGNQCVDCGTSAPYKVIVFRTPSEERYIYVEDGKKIFNFHTHKAYDVTKNDERDLIGVMMSSTQRPGIIMLQNRMGNSEWEVTFPDNSVRMKHFGEKLPLVTGVKIKINSSGTTLEIK